MGHFTQKVNSIKTLKDHFSSKCTGYSFSNCIHVYWFTDINFLSVMPNSLKEANNFFKHFFSPAWHVFFQLYILKMSLLSSCHKRKESYFLRYSVLTANQHKKGTKTWDGKIRSLKHKTVRQLSPKGTRGIWHTCQRWGVTLGTWHSSDILETTSPEQEFCSQRNDGMCHVSVPNREWFEHISLQWRNIKY